jgi:FkbM family methyltransferase
MMARLNLERIGDHTVLTNALDTDSLVIDAGANEGEFTRAVARRFDCRVHAIEPKLELHSRLFDSPKVRRHRFALSGTPGKVELNVCSNRCATILKLLDGETALSERVDAVTLAQFMTRNNISRINLLKLDIEGAEVSLLEAASDEELRKIDQLTIEFHGFVYPELQPRIDAIKRRMHRLGFWCMNCSSRRDTDVLMLNRERLQISWCDYVRLRYVSRLTAGISRRWQRSGSPQPHAHAPS